LRHRARQEKDASKLIFNIASALKHLHVRGIAHCDLKVRQR
jgi:serine/threonine protein kinase